MSVELHNPMVEEPSFSAWQKALFWLLLALFVFAFPFALINREIYIDEAWIGEQAKALLEHGTIVTNLFRDHVPLNQQIVIYHKLLVWLGAASLAIFGWGLYPLRLVSALAGLIMLLAFYFHWRKAESQRLAAIGVMLLLWTPVCWEMMRVYRPEMLVTCLGLGSYIVLHQARAREKTWLFVASGLLSGLSGSTHPAGMAFAAAGFVALLFERRNLCAVIFLAAAVVGFFPYVSGFVTNNAEATQQIFHNDWLTRLVKVHWWTPFFNLLEEHKRVFRQPMVIGISVMFFLSLLLSRRDDFRRHRFFWLYLATLFVCGAMAPYPKYSRYMLPLVPFFVIVCARAIDRWLTERKHTSRSLQTVFAAWVAVFILYGGIALGRAALINRQAPEEISTNRAFAAQMVKGSLVIAPPKFIFPELDSFVIQAYWGAHIAAGDERTYHTLENYAAKMGVRYLYIGSEAILDWSLDMSDGGRRFELYHPLMAFPERESYLLVKDN
jgi:4-amino-4-deoxy-L-arabinose transferase-like glycosyltransferase